MKIEHIRVAALLGARDVSIPTTGVPVHLICGANGQGKSSIRDAVMLALTGDVARVKLKRDYPLLITEGYQAAMAEALVDGTLHTVAINKAGKLTNSHASRDVDPRLPFVLDAQRIGKLSQDERRVFAFGVLGIKHDHAAIATKLKARKLDAGKVAEVSNFLRVGFDAAHEEAKRQASNSRAAWKAITGETYGERKAAGWKAAAPEFDDAEIEAQRAAAVALDDDLAAANRMHGGVVATAGIVADAREQIETLREVAGMVARRRDKVAADEAGRETARAALEAAEQAASEAPKSGLIHDLARSLDKAVRQVAEQKIDAPWSDDACAHLDAYEAEHGAISEQGQADPEAIARIPALREALTLMERAASNARRDMLASEAAAAELARLQTVIDENPVNADDVDGATAEITDVMTRRTAAMDKLRAMEADKVTAGLAAQKTEQAAGHHAATAAWDAIAAALAPEGLQSEILAESLKPLNDRLAQSAADTGWPVVFVRHDMAITAAGRPYELLSVSEQWRCDAVLAEAATHLSGLRLLMLDGMDVLEPAARPQLLGWLDVLAANNEVDTVLVFATLKTPPQGMPETIGVHWIEAGRCGETEAMAA